MKRVTLAVLTAGSLIVGGCNRSGDTTTSNSGRTQLAEAEGAGEHGHAHGPGSDHAHDEEAADRAHPQASGAPHGGTPIQVGDHGFHLELVPDPIDAKMLAYVLDGHMEKAVNVPATSFEMIAKAGDQEYRLTFTAVTNAPKGTDGKTSLFSAPAGSILEVASFEGVIPKITLDGRTFENVTFSYPKGSRHSHEAP